MARPHSYTGAAIDDRYAILFLSRNVTVGRLEISPVPEHRRQDW
jgi:hypothetical protein